MDKSMKAGNQNMSVYDIIVDMFNMKSGAFIGEVNNPENTPSRPIIWQPTTNKVM